MHENDKDIPVSTNGQAMISRRSGRVEDFPCLKMLLLALKMKDHHVDLPTLANLHLATATSLAQDHSSDMAKATQTCGQAKILR